MGYHYSFDYCLHTLFRLDVNVFKENVVMANYELKIMRAVQYPYGVQRHDATNDILYPFTPTLMLIRLGTRLSKTPTDLLSTTSILVSKN